MCTAWPPRSRTAAGALPRWPRPSPSSPTLLSDKFVARVARDHEAAGVPLVRGQGQLRREARRLHQRLIVDHDELALVRPAVPLPGALVAQQPQLRAAVGGRAVVGNLQLAPARPVLRQEEIVREVGGVGHDERVGGEELRRGHHLVGPSVVRKAHCYLQRRGCLRDSELAGKEAVYLCDGVVAEQRGCDARAVAVLVCG